MQVTDPYDDLVMSGAIGSLKRDIMLEAAEDLMYLCHVRHWFEKASADAAKDATRHTVRIVTELIGANLCCLATFGEEVGSFEHLEKSRSEIQDAVEKYGLPGANAFDLFLVATERGKQWVARYNELVDELQVPWA